MKVKGRVSVVTGGASGMGRSLVCQLAEQGSHVACCDVNMPELEETVRLAKSKNPTVKVIAYKCDVSDRSNVEEFCEHVLRDFDGKVHLFFANAGITKVGSLIHDSGMSKEEIQAREREWDRCFDIDYFGVLHCLRVFLQHIIKQDKGYVIITSSVNGFWTWPDHGCYTAAKFAVTGLAESLLVETYLKAPHVQVASVHPGGIKTGLVKNSFEATDEVNALHTDFTTNAADLTSDEAAAWILDGVRKDKTRILVGYDAICFDIMKRFGPHQSYNIWKALGKEGLANFDAERLSLTKKQLSNISALGWIRAMYGGLGRFLFFMFPTLILMQRRSPFFKLAVAAAGIYGVRRIAKL